MKRNFRFLHIFLLFQKLPINYQRSAYTNVTVDQTRKGQGDYGLGKIRNCPCLQREKGKERYKKIFYPNLV